MEGNLSIDSTGHLTQGLDWDGRRSPGICNTMYHINRDVKRNMGKGDNSPINLKGKGIGTLQYHSEDLNNSLIALDIKLQTTAQIPYLTQQIKLKCTFDF